MYRDVIDYDLLREALTTLLMRLGRGGQSEILYTTKVSNVGRIANGEIKAPSIETWGKLHKAYPDAIPAPTLKDGTVISDMSNKTSNVQNGNTLSGPGRHKITGYNYDKSSAKEAISKEALELARLIELTESKLTIIQRIRELQEKVDSIMGGDQQKKMIQAIM